MLTTIFATVKQQTSAGKTGLKPLATQMHIYRKQVAFELEHKFDILDASMFPDFKPSC